MQGLSPNQLERLQTQLENTQQALEAENYTGLIKHVVTGDLLQAGIQGYLATTYAMDGVEEGARHQTQNALYVEMKVTAHELKITTLRRTLS